MVDASGAGEQSTARRFGDTYLDSRQGHSQNVSRDLCAKPPRIRPVAWDTEAGGNSVATALCFVRQDNRIFGHLQDYGPLLASGGWKTLIGERDDRLTMQVAWPPARQKYLVLVLVRPRYSHKRSPIVRMLGKCAWVRNDRESWGCVDFGGGARKRRTLGTGLHCFVQRQARFWLSEKLHGWQS